MNTKHLGAYIDISFRKFPFVFDENVEIVNMLSFSSLGRMDKLKKNFPHYN